MNAVKLRTGFALATAVFSLLTWAGLTFDWRGAAASMAVVGLLLAPLGWIILSFIAKSAPAIKWTNVALAAVTIFGFFAGGLFHLLLAIAIAVLFFLKRI